MRRYYRRNKAWILGSIGILGFILTWELGSRFGLLNPFFFSRPTLVMEAFGRQWASGQLPDDLRVSLLELVVGFGGAVLIGVPLGVAMGRVRWFEYVLDPYIWFFYSAPLVAFYPFFIILFGLGPPTVVAITFLLSFFPVVVNTIAGVQNVEQVLVRAAHSFGATPMDLIFKIILPSALPIIVAGLRLAAGRALLGVIIGEFFGANAGLGFRVAMLGARIRLTEVFAPLVLVVAMGIILTQGMKFIENRVSLWYADR